MPGPRAVYGNQLAGGGGRQNNSSECSGAWRRGAAMHPVLDWEQAGGERERARTTATRAVQQGTGAHALCGAREGTFL